MEKGIELEKRVANLFEKFGWQVTTNRLFLIDNQKAIQPDLVLEDGENLMGFVEVKTNLELLTDDTVINRVRLIMKEHAQFAFFTDGISFDLYIYGSFYGNFPYPLSPNDISILINNRGLE